MESKRKELTFDHNPIEEGEKLVQGYSRCPDIRFASGSAYYSPGLDYISVPPLRDYPNPHEYYCTLYHEMIHSSGHSSRLNRQGIIAKAAFGSETYSKEELVAEMGASMLCAVAKIDSHTIENSASYIKSWLKVLKGNSQLVVQAASQAQKAVDFILGTSFEKDHNRDEDSE